MEAEKQYSTGLQLITPQSGERDVPVLLPAITLEGRAMNPISRRTMLAATTAGGLLAATAAGNAQTQQARSAATTPRLRRQDPGPRNLVRHRENPICWCRLPPITVVAEPAVSFSELSLR